ncbi:MAG: hypothetical protein CMG55_05180 [Candidatus Marinimicrobia bacterium]|nr:hypothetical protein [Candidatus Neomarinimicrobiota bacterium]
MRNIDSRFLAFFILKKFEQKDIKITKARDDVFLKYSPKNSFKNRAIVLANEVVRLRARLDLMIEFISNKKIKRLDGSIIIIMRLGFYEIIFDRYVPNYAAVDSFVQLAHHFSSKKSAGFTNAVLRNLIRKIKSDKYWYKPIRTASGWSSLPNWIDERWLNRYSKVHYDKLIDYINKPSDLYIRCDNKSKSIENIIEVFENKGIKTDLFLKNILLVRSSSSKILGSNLFNNGDISIQSPSSAAIVYCLDVKNGDRVLDVCAAPGTKTLQLAHLVGDRGVVYASDTSSDRVALGIKDIKRHGRKNIHWSVKDATKDTYEKVDKILIDAPCTGTGVIGRKPDIRWRRKAEDLKKFTKLQLSILNHCSQFLKNGGSMVYSTCSLEPEENLVVVENFLNLNSNFTIDELPSAIPNFWIKDKHFLNTSPHLHGIDGMFAIRIKKV